MWRWSFEGRVRWCLDVPAADGIVGDFKEEFGSADSLAFDVKEIIGIHDDYDMALLRVEQTSGHKALPTPLPVAPVAAPRRPSPGARSM